MGRRSGYRRGIGMRWGCCWLGMWLRGSLGGRGVGIEVRVFLFFSRQVFFFYFFCSPRGVGGGEGKEKRKERRKGKAVSLFRLKLSPKQPSSPAYDQTPTVIDLIRTHYHSADLTAPPYRLEYITRYAPGSLMQRFLFSTAAYRCLSSSSSVSNSPANSPSAAPSPDPAISEAMKTMFLKTPNLAVEFIEALIRVHREGCRDARKGLSCPEWHVHERTKVCPRGFVEAWEGE